VTLQLLVKYIADGLKSKGRGLLYLASCNRKILMDSWERSGARVRMSA